MRHIPELILSALLLAVPSGVALGAQAGAGPAQSAVYREGRDAIDSLDWARAERSFREYLLQRRPERGDAALFYLAFALKKQLRFAEVRECLARLRKEYPTSGWVEDAAAMEAEMIFEAIRPTSTQEDAAQQRRRQAARVLIASLATDKDAASFAQLRGIALGGDGELASASIRVLKSYPQASQPAFYGQLAEAGKSTSGRRYAIWALAEMRSPEAAAELLRLFRSLQDRSLRKVIVADLGGRADSLPKAREVLEEIQNTVDGEDFRQAITHYLTEVDTPEARNALLAWYALESDEEIKLTVIAMLGTNYGDHAAVRAKLQEIADGPNPQLAKQARGVLSGVGWGTTFPYLQRRDARRIQRGSPR